MPAASGETPAVSGPAASGAAAAHGGLRARVTPRRRRTAARGAGPAARRKCKRRRAWSARGRSLGVDLAAVDRIGVPNLGVGRGQSGLTQVANQARLQLHRARSGAGKPLTAACCKGLLCKARRPAGRPRQPQARARRPPWRWTPCGQARVRVAAPFLGRTPPSGWRGRCACGLDRWWVGGWGGGGKRAGGRVGAWVVGGAAAVQRMQQPVRARARQRARGGRVRRQAGA